MKDRRNEQEHAKDIKDISVTSSVGNVFSDLGLPDPEEALVKSNLAMKITSIIENRQLSQAEAAAILGIPQPRVSKIKLGKLRGLSLEKLCHLLTLLGRDVEIVVKDSNQSGMGRMSVTHL